VAGRYVLALTCSDGSMTSIIDQVVIIVATGNLPPVANAGPDQTVTAGQQVTLDGTRSSDPNGDPLTYSWCLKGRPVGSTATLSGANTAHPTFTAPSDADSLTFQLTVTSTGTLGQQSDVSSVTVDAAYNVAPVANAGASQSGKSVGKPVTLDGSASSDANNDPLTYTWTQTGGASVTLSDVHAVKPTFTSTKTWSVP